ncbi:MAG: hypothetical protein J5671_01825 [Bacteroidaceae bacterium]|nr:hypothetical protein [Bacteroidaceae bacterium]
MKKLLLKTLLLLCCMIAGVTSAWATDPVTLVSGSGTSDYTVPTGWTTSGTVDGGSYLKFDNGTMTSSSFGPHTSLSFTYTVATFGSGTNHPLTIRILNASTNAVIVEKTTATPTSNSYISTDSPISLGDISVNFKIQLYAPTGKGIRLRNYSVTGIPSGGDPTIDTSIGLASTSGSTTYGTPISVGHSLTDGYTGTMSATVVPDIATVSISTSPKTITFTPKAVGTATITISAPANGDYKAATNETYTLTVTAPAGGTTAPAAPVKVWSETWDKTNGEGGNDGKWSGSLTFASVTSDQTGWSYTSQGGANKCIKLGASSTKGSATTPAFGQAGNMIVEFKAAAWDGSSEQTDLILSVTGGGTLSESSVSMTKGEFNNYAVAIKGATADTKLTFAGKNKSNSRFFLDEVVVSKGELIKAKLNDSGYATFCSQYPLDFSKANAEDKGFTAWQVTEANSSTGVITFSQITGSIKGGQGILLKGSASTTVNIKSVDSSTELSGNLLKGTTAPEYFAANEIYGLSGDKFYSNSACTLPAGKAYLPVGSVGTGSGVKGFTFVFVDSETGIETVEKVGAEDIQAIFDMTGRRLSRMQKGINIVNGKKILVK